MERAPGTRWIGGWVGPYLTESYESNYGSVQSNICTVDWVFTVVLYPMYCSNATDVCT